MFCLVASSAAPTRPAEERRPLGVLQRPLASGSSQLILPAEDPAAFAASLAVGTWLAVGGEGSKEIPLRRAISSPGAVMLELLWPTTQAHGQGDGLDNLSNPSGLHVDADGTVYIADTSNHRIVKWAESESEGYLEVHPAAVTAGSLLP